MINDISFPRLHAWHLALVLGAMVAIMAGCASQSAPKADSSVGVQSTPVVFLHAPPPNAKFIAKIVYSSGDYDNWQSNCVQYLSFKAAKLGGNVVVPGVELDFGAHRLYNDSLSGQPPNFVVRTQIHGRSPYGYPQAASVSVAPAHFHFWSNVYYCPE